VNHLIVAILFALFLIPAAAPRATAGFGFGLDASIVSFAPALLERGKRTAMTVSVKNDGIPSNMFLRIKEQPVGWTVESFVPASVFIPNDATRVFQFFVTAPTSGDFNISIELFGEDLPLQIKLDERTLSVKVQSIPEPFNIFTPIQGEEVPDAVNLSWSFSVGADTYDVGIFEFINGVPVSPAKLNFNGLSNTSIIIPNASFIKGNTYQATVTARNLVGSRVNTDGPRRFTIRAAPTLGAFSIVSPIANQLTTGRPTIDWTTSTGARNYTLFVLPNEGGNPGSAPIREVPALTATEYTWADPPLVAGRSYFVSVRAFGEPSAASRLNQEGPVPFSIPGLTSFQLISPTADSTRIALLPEFRWQVSGGATYYILFIERFTEFGWRRLFQDRIEQSEGVMTYPIPASKPLRWNELYRWNVTAQRADANGNVLEVISSVGGFQEFRTTQLAPFDLLSPASGSPGVPVRPTFMWESTPTATVYTVESAVRGADGEPVLAGRRVSPALIETTWVSLFPDLTPGGRYFWRVRATDGLASQYSYGDWQPFTVTTLGQFGIVSPVNLTTELSTQPTFTWSPSPGAKTYRLRIAIKGGIILPDLVVNAPQNSVDFSQVGRNLNSLTDYLWTVVAEDGIVTLGAPQIFEFRTGVRSEVGSRDVLDHLIGRQQFSAVDRASAGFFGSARIDAAGYMQVRLVEE